jgi:hypothetical protein
MDKAYTGMGKQFNIHFRYSAGKKPFLTFRGSFSMMVQKDFLFYKTGGEL